MPEMPGQFLYRVSGSTSVLRACIRMLHQAHVTLTTPFRPLSRPVFVEPFAWLPVSPRQAAAARGRKRNEGESPMLNLRYVVVSEESRWQIVHGGRRFPETYPSKRQAVRSAIALAERDGLAGRRAEVMVRHENGLFITERVFGANVGAERAAARLLLASSESS
jgi:hypothetical protein